jgi:hypothetical protein
VTNLAQGCIILITEGYYFIQLFDGNIILIYETHLFRERVSSSNIRNWKITILKFNILILHNAWNLSLNCKNPTGLESRQAEQWLQGSSFPTCILDGHLHRVTHTRRSIDTIDSPEDENEVARNM